jgi:hypothetical protein
MFLQPLKPLALCEHVSWPYSIAIDTSQRIVKMESWFIFNPWKAIGREQTVSSTNLFLFHYFTWKSFVTEVEKTLLAPLTVRLPLSPQRCDCSAVTVGMCMELMTNFFNVAYILVLDCITAPRCFIHIHSSVIDATIQYWQVTASLKGNLKISSTLPKY